MEGVFANYNPTTLLICYLNAREMRSERDQ